MRHGKLEWINILDKSFFFCLFFILSIFYKKKKTPYFIDKNAIKKVLIIRQGGLGDVFLSLPFFRLLKKELNLDVLDIVCVKRNISAINILQAEILFDKIFLLERNFQYLFKKYDLVINLDQSKYEYVTPTLMALISAKYKIGYDIKNRARFYTHKVVYRHEEYEAQSIINILQYLEIFQNVEEVNLLAKDTEKLKFQAKNILLSSGVKDRFVVLSIGGLNSQNKLNLTTVVKLSQALLDQHYNILFVGNKIDYLQTEKIIDLIHRDSRVHNLCGKFSLKETISILSSADYFIGYDGGPLHLAVFAGTKTISIWGPSLFGKWSPKNIERHFFIKTNLPCQPCLYGRFPMFLKCPYDMKCMKDLEKDDFVVKKIINIIQDDTM